MLRGLLDLAHGAQKAPVPACSCAKGLAVGLQLLASSLSEPGGGPNASGGARDTARGPGGAAAHSLPAPAMWRPAWAARSPGGASSSGSGGGPAQAQTPSALYNSVDLDSGLPAHDAHALRMVLLRSAAQS